MRSPLLIALGLWWRNNERNYWALLALLPWSCLMALGHLGQHTLVACAVQENISCLFWGFKFLALRAFWSPWWHTTTLSRGTSELELRIPPSCEFHSLMRVSSVSLSERSYSKFLGFPLRNYFAFWNYVPDWLIDIMSLSEITSLATIFNRAINQNPIPGLRLIAFFMFQFLYS